MEVLYPVCSGLDVHKARVTACLRAPGAGAPRRQEVRTFGTTTRELLRLVDWLTAAGCKHVAMESTGVYWRPVYNLLEGSFELFLVNAQHVKMVPGRKTDVRDSEWLAQLLELGLLRRSFVPPAAQQARGPRRSAHRARDGPSSLYAGSAPAPHRVPRRGHRHVRPPRPDAHRGADGRARPARHHPRRRAPDGRGDRRRA